MNWSGRRPLRDLDRGHGLFLIGVGAVAAGCWLVLAPDSVSQVLERVERLADEYGVRFIAVLLGLLVLLLAGLRLVRRTSAALDRSPILDTPPETVDPVRGRSNSADDTIGFRRLRARCTNPGRVERHAAMYGRRAESTTQLPESVEGFFDDLARTAEVVVATGTGCDEATAKRVVADGSWTDDRIAAAFLAAPDAGGPTFSRTERLRAWLTPGPTLEARVARTMDAIEGTAEDFLRFQTAVEDPARPDRIPGHEDSAPRAGRWD